MPHGTIISEQYAASGIHISAVANEGRPNNLISFNSNASGTKDPALEAGIGNLAIIPENIDDINGDGLVDHPSDSIRGGKQIYAFDSERTIGAFTIVDSDHGNQSTHFAVAYDAGGSLIKRVPIPILTNGSVQTVTVHASGVRRLEIVARDSTGVTNIEIGCQASTATLSSPPTTVASSSASPAPVAVLPGVFPPTGGQPAAQDSWPVALVMSGLSLLGGAGTLVLRRSATKQ